MDIVQHVNKNRVILIKTKLKGGALYVSILVSVVIGILLSLLILLSEYEQRVIFRSSSFQQLHRNLESAFQMSQSTFLKDGIEGNWFKNTYNEDSIRIQKKSWGAYDVFCLQTKNRHNQLSETGVYGHLSLTDTALMVSDYGRALSVSGIFVLKGDAFLPKSGIRPAFIEGQSYISVPENSHYIKAAPLGIPQANLRFLERINSQKTVEIREDDSLIETLPIELNQSFENHTLVYRTGILHLSHQRLKGNIKLIAHEIKIDSACRLENILLVCKKIRFADGFKGTLHVIASDSISTGSKSVFDYPSSMIICSEKEKSSTFQTIELGSYSVFKGAILAFGNGRNALQKVFVKLHKGSEVRGMVYSSDYLHLEGKHGATIIADKLLLKTPSAVYENHLLSCEVNPKKFKGIMALPNIFDKTVEYVCAVRLN